MVVGQHLVNFPGRDRCLLYLKLTLMNKPSYLQVRFKSSFNDENVKHFVCTSNDGQTELYHDSHRGLSVPNTTFKSELTS